MSAVITITIRERKDGGLNVHDDSVILGPTNAEADAVKVIQATVKHVLRGLYDRVEEGDAK